MMAEDGRSISECFSGNRGPESGRSHRLWDDSFSLIVGAWEACAHRPSVMRSVLYLMVGACRPNTLTHTGWSDLDEIKVGIH